MRILRLKFKNLNSLAGEWCVDFTDPAFEDGIFAITGPTGAGKSTILDAMCLALYGRTPRLNVISESTNEIMSRRTGECWVELAFETQQGAFLCHWSQRRARGQATGALQSVKREISRLDTGEILFSKLKDVSGAIERITGMNFDRFTRSMLLAQGDFAAFLQAKPDERAPILEQITGTQIYSDISRQAHFIKAELTKDYSLMQAAFSAFQVLGAEEEQELEAELVKQQQLAASATNLRKSFDLILNLSAELQKDELALEAGARSMPELTAKHQKAQTELAVLTTRLDKNIAALQALQPVLQQTRLMDARIKDKKVQLERLQVQGQEQTRLKAGLVLKQESAAAILQKNIAERVSLQQKLQASAGDVELLETCGLLQGRADAIVRVAAGATQLSSEAAQKLHNYIVESANKNKLDAVAKNYAAELEQEQNTTALNGQKLAALLGGKSVREWRDYLAKVQAQHEHRRGLANILAALQEQVAQFASLYKKQEETGAALKKLEAELVLGQVALAAAEKEEELLELQLELVNRISSLSEERERLSSGSPCPLCGALEHPFVQAFADGGVPKSSESRLALNAARQKRQQAGAELNKLQIRQAELSKSVEFTRASLSAVVAEGADKYHLLDVTTQTIVFEDGNIAEPDLALHMEQMPHMDIASILQEMRSNGLEAVVLPQDCADTDDARFTSWGLSSLPQRYIAVVENYVNADVQHLDAARQQALDLLGQAEFLQKNMEAAQARLAGQKDSLNSAMRAVELSAQRMLSLSEAIQELQGEYAAALDSLSSSVTGFNATLQPFGLSFAPASPAALRWLLSVCLDGGAGEQTNAINVRLDNGQNTTAESFTCAADATAAFSGTLQTALQEALAPLLVRRDKRRALEAEAAALEPRIAAMQLEEQADRLELENLNVELARVQSEVAALQEELELDSRERENIFGTKTPDTEEATFKTATTQAEVEVKAQQQQLNKFALELEALNARCATLQGGIVERKASLHSAKGELEQVLSLSRPLFGENLLIRELEQVLEAQNSEQQVNTAIYLQQMQKLTDKIRPFETAMLKAVGGVQQKLNDNARLKQDKSKELARLEIKKQELARWGVLHELIGSADGKKFRNFAQGLTLDIVLQQANVQLARMSGRYVLARSEYNSLDLCVIDNFQAGEIRSTRNLSGGESFIVSLALALGLSRMASKNVRVDSLFLDEGFGTLDEEALDIALDTLGNLRQSGKLIGIISHVAALRERVATQIKVRPAAEGKSFIQGPGCSGG